jgi:formylglycine-generating enzyme
MSPNPQDPTDAATDPDPGKGRPPDGIARPWLLVSLVGGAAILCTVCALLSSPPAGGAVRINQRDGLRYVWIPSGGFQQGCSKFDSECSPEEKPAHAVMMSKGFWIGQTEVTVAAYRRFILATHRSMPPEAAFRGHNLNPGWANGKLPAVNVTWNESKSYCEWAGGRLPTEAQWEYAARGDDPAERYGPPSQIAWTAYNSGAKPLDGSALPAPDDAHFLESLSINGNTFHEVGLLEPNYFGLFDMLGNAWEWTADWFAEDSYRDFERSNPAGRPSGEAKVLRGGAWVSASNVVRASVRARRAPAARSIDTGFRCVL